MPDTPQNQEVFPQQKGQKEGLAFPIALTAIHVAEEVCFPVAHRQVVLTLPKRLRLHSALRPQAAGQALLLRLDLH